MIYAVVIEARAERDFTEAVNFYDQREPGLGQRFAREVADVFREVASDPNRFALVGVRSRKAKILTWPYPIYYTIREQPPQVVIHDVFHGNRDPSVLRRRLR